MSEQHRWIVDRFEGDLAVVEADGDRVLDVPRWLLPADAAEGDVIVVAVRSEGGTERGLDLRIDREATERVRDEAQRLIDDLRRRDPGGDVNL